LHGTIIQSSFRCTYRLALDAGPGERLSRFPLAGLEFGDGCKCATVAYTAAHNYSNDVVPARTAAAPLRGATLPHFWTQGGVMKTVRFNHRAFLKSAVASSAVVGVGLPQSAQAQQKAAVPPTPSAGRAYLNPEDGAFAATTASSPATASPQA
jgi:hypothetical protein